MSSSLGIEQFPTIDKYFGEAIHQDMKEDHPNFPLVDQLQRQNKTYLSGLELILRDQESLAGFTGIVHDSRNPTGFYDNMLTLQFCQLLKESGYHVDGVFGSKGPSKKPDISFRVGGRAAYAECKHLTDVNAVTNMLIDHFRGVESMFHVSVTFVEGTTFYISTVEQLIRTIAAKIRNKERTQDFSNESFVVKGVAKCRFSYKRQKGPTGVSVTRSYRHITVDTFRTKITDLMEHANSQFEHLHEDLNYLFISSDLVTLDSREIDTLLNGTPVIPRYRLEEEKLTLIGTTSNMNGLFLRENFRNLSSLVFVDLMKHMYEFPNPGCQKGATRLFQSESCFPLSTEWLNKRV